MITTHFEYFNNDKVVLLRSKIISDKVVKGHKFKAHCHAAQVCGEMDNPTRLDWYIAFYEEFWALQQN